MCCGGQALTFRLLRGDDVTHPSGRLSGIHCNLSGLPSCSSVGKCLCLGAFFLTLDPSDFLSMVADDPGDAFLLSLDLGDEILGGLVNHLPDSIDRLFYNLPAFLDLDPHCS